MSFLSQLVQILLNSGAPLEIEDCNDDRMYVQRFEVSGEDVEITNFDTEPQEMKWGEWRCNSNGDVF